MFRSCSERRWWIASGLYFGAILVSLYPAQFALLALRERGWLGPSITILFAVCALAVVWRVVRLRPGWREGATAVGAGLVYLLLLGRMSILQERLHLLEYGLLGLLLFAAVEERARATPSPPAAWRLPAAAILLTGLAGWADEGVQAVLPNRVYDLRDVGFNTLAGALAVLTLAACRRARARDARARS